MNSSCCGYSLSSFQKEVFVETATAGGVAKTGPARGFGAAATGGCGVGAVLVAMVVTFLPLFNWVVTVTSFGASLRLSRISARPTGESSWIVLEAFLAA